jgi:hypothetical protein
MYSRLDKVLFSQALVMGLVVAMSGHFVSYPRYLLAAFPLFVVMANVFKDRWWMVSIPMIAAQAFLLITHSLNYWVA